MVNPWLKCRNYSIVAISKTIFNNKWYQTTLSPSRAFLHYLTVISPYQLSSSSTSWEHKMIHGGCSQGSVRTASTSNVASRLNQHQNSTTDGESLLRRFFVKLGLAPSLRHRLRLSSHLLYESVADRINYMYFFETFELPNTFNTWFLITELHVWMLLLRAMAEGSNSNDDGRFLRNCIVEAMWSDVNVRATKLSQNKSRNRQQIEELSEQFQAALLAYDEGIMSEDRILASALWRRFFAMNCDDCAQIERMVKYVRYQVALLEKTPSNKFLISPNICWLNLENIHV